MEIIDKRLSVQTKVGSLGPGQAFIATNGFIYRVIDFITTSRVTVACAANRVCCLNLESGALIGFTIESLVRPTEVESITIK